MMISRQVPLIYPKRHHTKLCWFSFLRYCCCATHDIAPSTSCRSTMKTNQEKYDETLSRELSRLTKRKRVDAGLERSSLPRGRFYWAKGGRACGRLMFPRPRTKKDSRPSSQSQKCLRGERKETKLYMDEGGRRGRDTQVRGETIADGSQLARSWRFPLPAAIAAALGMQRRIYGSQRGGHSSPWRSPLLLLLLLHFRLLCACA